MMENLNNKVVLIIGATGGIGTELSKEISQKGAACILFSRNEEKLNNLAAQLNENTLTICGDATNVEDLNRAVDAGIEKFGTIDVLIHAVGSIVLKSLNNTPDNVFKETLNLNLISPFNSIKAVLPVMLKNKSGSVIVLSSIAGSKGLMNHEAISAAKGGLEAMIRSASVTYAKRGIRFNSVALGLIDTPLSEFLTNNEISLNRSISMHPAGRIGKPEDVKGAVLYLASDSSKWTTGNTIHVDGGMSAN